MRPGKQAYIVTIEVRDVYAVSAEEAANAVREDMRSGIDGVRVVRSTPQNPTISDAIHRGEAGAL